MDIITHTFRHTRTRADYCAQRTPLHPALHCPTPAARTHSLPPPTTPAPRATVTCRVTRCTLTPTDAAVDYFSRTARTRYTCAAPAPLHPLPRRQPTAVVTRQSSTRAGTPPCTARTPAAAATACRTLLHTRLPAACLPCWLLRTFCAFWHTHAHTRTPRTPHAHHRAPRTDNGRTFLRSTDYAHLP